MPGVDESGSQRLGQRGCWSCWLQQLSVPSTGETGEIRPCRWHRQRSHQVMSRIAWHRGQVKREGFLQCGGSRSRCFTATVSASAWMPSRMIVHLSPTRHHPAPQL